jgi:ABC-2 type transport system ATP-binding protein
MSTHDIFRAKEVADIIGIMNNGKLVMQKNNSEIKDQDLEKLYMEYMAGYMDQQN